MVKLLTFYCVLHYVRAHATTGGTMTITLSTAPAGKCPFGHGGGASETFDPFSLDYQINPGEHAKWARENEPIFFHEKLGYWVVTRYADVQEVFRDNITFSPSVALEKITPLTEEAKQILADHDFALRRTLVNEDEPDHTARRRALGGAFDIEHLEEHEEMVRRLVTERIDGFIDNGNVDLVPGLLYEVPLMVAFHFLGVPEHDMDLLHKYSVAHTVSTWGKPTDEEQIEIAESVGKFWQLAGKILEELRETPDADGWMPMSIRAQKEQPDVVTDSYLHSMMMAGIVAAHETTAFSGANAMKLLLENREIWELLCEKPELIPNAIEESLRLSGGVAAWRRISTRPTTLGGVELPEGARVLMVSAAANRDPEMFPDPDAIDLYRDNVSKHLTFGFGSHQCLGKNLARLELQVILQELTTRLPHLELVEDQDFGYVPNTSFRGPQHLEVEWNPEANPERQAMAQKNIHPEIIFNGPSRELRTRRMSVTEIDDVAQGIRRIVLRSEDGSRLPNSWPGAHIEIEVDGFNRHYSLCGQGTDYWEIAVALDPESRGGSAWIHENVRNGSVLNVRGPRSNFRADTSATQLILVAGGVGITPMLAMADEAKARGIDYELHYAGKHRDKMAYLDRIECDHGEHTRIYVSMEGLRLDVSSFADRQSPGVQVLTCGPDRLTSALLDALAHWPADTVRRESFSAANLADESENEQFTVVINSTGEELEVPANTTLLEYLENSGHDLYADCREGLCGTCEVGVLAGDPEHRDHLLSDREKIDGTRMLPCVSRGSCSSKLVLDL
ncbi:cytochrome P450/oxidoreductase [Corynebacterium sp. A21]|uniref:cytochrome P450/oxidoreductase n=1 Tax=Corynebacterium sp. A21 TaxID=3457318 RepID=UPI003FD51B7B